jgi:hypothetical protein
METPSPPHPVIDLSPQLYSQLVYTLTDLLPPPLDDTPEALRARNHAAIAKIAALLPVNADEIELAAQCIAARGEAEEMLRRVRQHAGDIELVMRLNARYGSMVRTSLLVHGRLMRVQALRQKREAIDGAAEEDAGVLRVAERSMLRVLHPRLRSVEAAGPKVAPVEAALVETPSAGGGQRVEENVSGDGADSHGTAIETWLSEQPWNQGLDGSSRTGLGEVIRRAMARSRLEGRDLPANGRESPGRVE